MEVKASDNTKVYLNENGPSIGVVNRNVIEKDGLYFKDIDGYEMDSQVGQDGLEEAVGFRTLEYAGVTAGDRVGYHIDVVDTAQQGIHIVGTKHAFRFAQEPADSVSRGGSGENLVLAGDGSAVC